VVSAEGGVVAVVSEKGKVEIRRERLSIQEPIPATSFFSLTTSHCFTFSPCATAAAFDSPFPVEVAVRVA
jgi:hypothetical protein